MKTIMVLLVVIKREGHKLELKQTFIYNFNKTFRYYVEYNNNNIDSRNKIKFEG